MKSEKIDDVLETPTRVEGAQGLSLVLDTYWPVIEAARKVRERYTPVVDKDGEKVRTPVKVCPDESAELINALNKAESIMLIEREETETKNVK